MNFNPRNESPRAKELHRLTIVALLREYQTQAITQKKTDLASKIFWFIADLESSTTNYPNFDETEWKSYLEQISGFLDFIKEKSSKSSVNPPLSQKHLLQQIDSANPERYLENLGPSDEVTIQVVPSGSGFELRAPIAVAFGACIATGDRKEIKINLENYSNSNVSLTLDTSAPFSVDQQNASSKSFALSAGSIAAPVMSSAILSFQPTSAGTFDTLALDVSISAGAAKISKSIKLIASSSDVSLDASWIALPSSPAVALDAEIADNFSLMVHSNVAESGRRVATKPDGELVPFSGSSNTLDSGVVLLKKTAGSRSTEWSVESTKVSAASLYQPKWFANDESSQIAASKAADAVSLVMCANANHYARRKVGKTVDCETCAEYRGLCYIQTSNQPILVNQQKTTRVSGSESKVLTTFGTNLFFHLAPNEKVRLLKKKKPNEIVSLSSIESNASTYRRYDIALSEYPKLPIFVLETHSTPLSLGLVVNKNNPIEIIRKSKEWSVSMFEIECCTTINSNALVLMWNPHNIHLMITENFVDAAKFGEPEKNFQFEKSGIFTLNNLKLGKKFYVICEIPISVVLKSSTPGTKSFTPDIFVVDKNNFEAPWYYPSKIHNSNCTVRASLAPVITLYPLNHTSCLGNVPIIKMQNNNFICVPLELVVDEAAVELAITAQSAVTGPAQQSGFFSKLLNSSKNREGVMVKLGESPVAKLEKVVNFAKNTKINPVHKFVLYIPLEKQENENFFDITISFAINNNNCFKTFAESCVDRRFVGYATSNEAITGKPSTVMATRRELQNETTLYETLTWYNFSRFYDATRPALEKSASSSIPSSLPFPASVWKLMNDHVDSIFKPTETTDTFNLLSLASGLAFALSQKQSPDLKSVVDWFTPAVYNVDAAAGKSDNSASFLLGLDVLDGHRFLRETLPILQKLVHSSAASASPGENLLQMLDVATAAMMHPETSSLCASLQMYSDEPLKALWTAHAAINRSAGKEHFFENFLPRPRTSGRSLRSSSLVDEKQKEQQQLALLCCLLPSFLGEALHIATQAQINNNAANSTIPFSCVSVAHSLAVLTGDSGLSIVTFSIANHVFTSSANAAQRRVECTQFLCQSFSELKEFSDASYFEQLEIFCQTPNDVKNITAILVDGISTDFQQLLANSQELSAEKLLSDAFSAVRRLPASDQNRALASLLLLRRLHALCTCPTVPFDSAIIPMLLQLMGLLSRNRAFFFLSAFASETLRLGAAKDSASLERTWNNFFQFFKSAKMSSVADELKSLLTNQNPKQIFDFVSPRLDTTVFRAIDKVVFSGNSAFPTTAEEFFHLSATLDSTSLNALFSEEERRLMKYVVDHQSQLTTGNNNNTTLALIEAIEALGFFVYPSSYNPTQIGITIPEVLKAAVKMKLSITTEASSLIPGNPKLDLFFCDFLRLIGCVQTQMMYARNSSAVEAFMDLTDCDSRCAAALKRWKAEPAVSRNFAQVTSIKKFHDELSNSSSSSKGSAQQQSATADFSVQIKELLNFFDEDDRSIVDKIQLITADLAKLPGWSPSTSPSETTINKLVQYRELFTHAASNFYYALQTRKLINDAIGVGTRLADRPLANLLAHGIELLETRQTIKMICAIDPMFFFSELVSSERLIVDSLVKLNVATISDALKTLGYDVKSSSSSTTTRLIQEIGDFNKFVDSARSLTCDFEKSEREALQKQNVALSSQLKKYVGIRDECIQAINSSSFDSQNSLTVINDLLVSEKATAFPFFAKKSFSEALIRALDEGLVSASLVCDIIVKIASESDDAKILFATKSLCEACLVAFDSVSIPSDNISILRAVEVVTSNAQTVASFACDDLRDQLSSILSLNLSVESERDTMQLACLGVIQNLLSSDEGLRVFASTREFLEFMKKFGMENSASLKPQTKQRLDSCNRLLVQGVRKLGTKSTGAVGSSSPTAKDLQPGDSASSSSSSPNVISSPNTKPSHQDPFGAFGSSSSSNTAATASSSDLSLSSSQAEFAPMLLQQFNQENNTSLTLSDISTEMKNGIAVILKSIGKSSVAKSTPDFYKECSWLLSLIAEYKFKVDEEDIKILFDNSFNRKKFLKLDQAQMDALKLSPTAQLIFKKVIGDEKMKSLESALPLIKDSEITRGPRINSGSTCVVYEARYLLRDVAVKIFNDNVVNTPSFQREIKSGAPLRDDNIVALRGIVVDSFNPERVIGIMMERMSNENLAQRAATKPPLKQLLQWCFEAACGIHAAHHEKTIHSDIKPENILLSNSNPPVAKLTDFGCASILSATKTAVTQARGTPLFIAPEYTAPDLLEEFENCPYKSVPNPSTDVFSFGMTLWSVFHPTEDHGMGNIQSSIIRNLEKGKRPQFTAPNIPPLVKELIENCWDPHPGKRPSMEEAANVLRSVIAKM